MNDRDRLASLLEQAALSAYLETTDLKGTGYISDYLLAHGVTLAGEKRKTALDGKCGGCKWADATCQPFYGSSAYVRCTNSQAYCNTHPVSAYAPWRLRSYKGCKLYKAKEI